MPVCLNLSLESLFLCWKTLVTSFQSLLANHSSLKIPFRRQIIHILKNRDASWKFCDEVRNYTDKPITGVGGPNQPDFIEEQLANGRITQPP